jgi:hypothetical protein
VPGGAWPGIGGCSRGLRPRGSGTESPLAVGARQLRNYTLCLHQELILPALRGGRRPARSAFLQIPGSAVKRCLQDDCVTTTGAITGRGGRRRRTRRCWRRQAHMTNICGIADHMALWTRRAVAPPAKAAPATRRTPQARAAACCAADHCASRAAPPDSARPDRALAPPAGRRWGQRGRGVFDALFGFALWHIMP